MATDALPTLSALDPAAYKAVGACCRRRPSRALPVFSPIPHVFTHALQS